MSFPQGETIEKKGHLRFWLIILFVGLLFTVSLWDHYFNSENPIDQQLVSNLVLAMGALFSVAASLFAWSLESRLGFAERKVVERTDELQKQNEALEKAFSEIKVLRGFIPICSVCKKIRDDQGLWQQMELYIQRNSEALFSHGICGDCIKATYPKYAKDNKKSN